MVAERYTFDKDLVRLKQNGLREVYSDKEARYYLMYDRKDWLEAIVCLRKLAGGGEVVVHSVANHPIPERLIRYIERKGCRHKEDRFIR